MKLKTLQWNIGGGCICKQGEDATLPKSYSEYGLNSIIDLLKREKTGVVAPQETHTSPDQCQTQIIAGTLGY